jgi:hypothetical protein
VITYHHIDEGFRLEIRDYNWRYIFNNLGWVLLANFILSYVPGMHWAGNRLVNWVEAASIKVVNLPITREIADQIAEANGHPDAWTWLDENESFWNDFWTDIDNNEIEETRDE